ncbi:MAG: class I SAM-dependent DNA methyltransferase [Candidatus Hodarchaeota archaeon]
MYKELAKYYDLIYSWKDYEKEVKKITKLIRKYKISDSNKLLDVACGTGRHLEYLKINFSCTGIDLNQEILDVAKEKVSNVVFKQADMINFDLNEKFDILTCLFSSIGYVKTYTNLEKTLENFVKHLKKGGVAIIEPWLTKDNYDVGRPGMTIYETEDTKIARLNNTTIENNISIMDMHYLIAERNQDVKYFIDRHELALFEIEEFLNIMGKAGFKAEFLKNGLMKKRGLYIGIKL